MNYRMKTEMKNGKLMRMEATFEFQTPLIAEIVFGSLCPVGNSCGKGPHCFYLNGAVISSTRANQYDPIPEDTAKHFADTAEEFGKEAVVKEASVFPIALVLQRMMSDLSSVGPRIDSETQARTRSFRSFDERLDAIVRGVYDDGRKFPDPSLKSLSEEIESLKKRLKSVAAGGLPERMRRVEANVAELLVRMGGIEHKSSVSKHRRKGKGILLK